ncbi:MAG: hypothetical protein B7Y56_03125 [Gallionellales bacterium 35-53-114]|jgi:hypothetical protein|nr:MAG: hypothetical protein B7Y56_03125 [Gallionellales bacterium 35-53-114]OYZ65100.1 MAG: hypothetical protein B7Y04_00285 [Gallionellales bacterium 24-53-125]OZB08009.1 MAG: hypothetical protein B7X61_10735 [Gallionellales bacterium 39-52-133]HQS59750.1 hypothetical protein [Gallionellaceae bacterium]HQS76504.1 hypothetical protein [Gallionellaceae bacterium]
MDEKLVKQLFEDLFEANAVALSLLTAAAARQMETAQLTDLIANVKSSLFATKTKHPKPKIASLAIYIATSSLAALVAEIQLRQDTGKRH